MWPPALRCAIERWGRPRSNSLPPPSALAAGGPLPILQRDHPTFGSRIVVVRSRRPGGGTIRCLSRERFTRRALNNSAAKRARRTRGFVPSASPRKADHGFDSPRGKAFVTKVRGSRTEIFTADSTAVHGNETAALSLFEQPFCGGIQGAKVTLLRVQAIRRIAKSSGPTVRGQRIDRTGNPVTAKHHKERAGADTGGLSVRRVVLGTLHEVTARHNGRVQTLVTGSAATR